MILQISGRGVKQVDKPVFDWFVARLKEPRIQKFGNGTGYYQDSTLVAAELDGGVFYIKV